MSGLFRDVATAALPVAIVLLLVATAARAAVWQRIGGNEERLAHAYLEPLALWCLGALAVHVVAVGAAGDAGVVSVGVPLILAGGAALLPLSLAPAPSAPAAPTARPAPEPDPAPGGALWADGDDDERSHPTGLWSRA
jgi:hypothetical protein